MGTPRKPIHVHAGWSHGNSSEVLGLFINYIGLGSQHSCWKKTN